MSAGACLLWRTFNYASDCQNAQAPSGVASQSSMRYTIMFFPRQRNRSDEMGTESTDQPQPPIEAGVRALQRIVGAREQVSRIPRRLRERWQDASDDDLSKATKQSPIAIADKLSILFLHAERLAADALRYEDPVKLREAVARIYYACLLASRRKEYSDSARAGAMELAEVVGNGIRIPKWMRKEMRERAQEVLVDGASSSLSAFLQIDRPGLEAATTEIKRAISKAASFTVSVPSDSRVSDTVSAVDLLVDAADRQTAEVKTNPPTQVAYDMSGSELRIRSVRLVGFRGSPGDTTVDFLEGGSPVSAIIFGENGVGKSTVVDAIEFALQGRTGRSSNFDSPLAPSLRSLVSSTDPLAHVQLSDGTTVSRTATVSRDGFLVPVPADVRVGFRLAPISIKRSDILKFLDTEALERGSILLDYFPADASSMALRPEEEIHRLRWEMTELRIKRRSFAADLATLLRVEESDLLARDSFDRLIRDVVMGGRTQNQFEADNGWDGVQPRARELINLLASTHARLSYCKKRLERPVEVLNPVLYRSQTAMLKSILEEIGAELSAAFSRISQGYPVKQIDVVFGESGPLSLDLLVRLTDGTNCFPQQIFSEAYRDLVALLFFVSVARKASERGQVRILVLDDVLQSVDSTIRHGFVDYLLERFVDWQLIFTAHDRLWREQLRDLLASHRHDFVERRIEGWSFETGPKFGRPNVDLLTRDLRKVISDGEPRTISAISGQVLESACDQLTRKLRLPVPRKDGDRYTLGDLWPIVEGHFRGTQVDAIIQRIASHRGLRNLSVHSDPMSLSLSQVDAQKFGRSVLDLVDAVRCSVCRSWIRGQRTAECACGRLTL